MPALRAVLDKLSGHRAGRDRTMDHVQWWAGESSLEVVALERCGVPPRYVLRQFPNTIQRGESEHHYFRISVIDPDHVRRSGVARVHKRVEILDGMDQTVQAVWLTYEQLDWRTRPPRRTAELPHGREQGWYIDPTRRHELRWYSVGAPTDLVKDGAIESRDPPANAVAAE
jgi:hypothetical protein